MYAEKGVSRTGCRGLEKYAGKDRGRTGRMIVLWERRDMDRRVQDRRDAGQEGCRTGEIQDMRVQDRKDA